MLVLPALAVLLAAVARPALRLVPPAGAPACRLARPMMKLADQDPDRDETVRRAESQLPIGDRHSGGSVPFAPLGTAGGASTANKDALSGRTGHLVVPNQAPAEDAAAVDPTELDAEASASASSEDAMPGSGRDQTARTAGSRLPSGDRYSGGAVPFAPIGTGGYGSTANGDSFRGMTGPLPVPRTSAAIASFAGSNDPASPPGAATGDTTRADFFAAAASGESVAPREGAATAPTAATGAPPPPPAPTAPPAAAAPTAQGGPSGMGGMPVTEGRGKPHGDSASGGAMPFAPIGSAVAGDSSSSANAASLTGEIDSLPDSRPTPPRAAPRPTQPASAPPSAVPTATAVPRGGRAAAPPPPLAAPHHQPATARRTVTSTVAARCPLPRSAPPATAPPRTPTR